MVELQVDGLPIQFPYSPYQAQVDYMEKVIECLQHKTHGLLESPTGTGKTLCLLCAALAWMGTESPRDDGSTRRHLVLRCGADGSPPPTRMRTKIVYCSRTHAQLTQAIRELKKTKYGSTVSMALLGSRDHMCVNSEVQKLPSSSAQLSMCSHLRAERSCRFFQQLLSSKDTSSCLDEAHMVHDIEDLVQFGKQSGFCPYFHERYAAESADMVFMPYNYMLDPALRRQLPFEWKQCVLIVDEAHNLPSVLDESGRLKLEPVPLANAISDCDRAAAMQRLESAAEDVATRSMREQIFASLKLVLVRLEECINAESFGPVGTHSGAGEEVGAGELTRDGSYMFDFLSKALITHEMFAGGPQSVGLNESMTNAIEVLSTSESPASGIAHVQQFLAAVFENRTHLDSCRFVLQHSPTNGKKKGASAGRILGFWRLDSSAEMQELCASLHSLILTSGTLSPMLHFAAELGMAFDVIHKGAHVISPEQVRCMALCRGPGGGSLNGGYAFRNSVDYRVELGMTIVNLSRNTPGGTLVFFPSYTAMNGAVELWRAGSGRPEEKKTVWGLLTDMKPVFVEPNQSGDLPAVVQGFQRAVDESTSRGAILLGVCRGKISEGVDFSDNHGRMVVVTGIPYANHTDLFVRLKRAHLTAVAPQRPKVRGRAFTGDDWYRNEAMRAVNQCVGRVIRHQADYGCVVLADERFADQLGTLSEWVAQRSTVTKEFREAYSSTVQFFQGFRSAPRATTTSSEVERAAPPLAQQAEVLRSRLPASSAMAKAYEAEQRRFSLEDAQARQRCRLEEASETPLRLSDAHAPSRAMPTTSLVSPSSSRSHHLATVKGVMQKQVVEHVEMAPSTTVIDVDAPPPPQLGSTSKEFCAFLKARLPSDGYAIFRDGLKEIAACRATVGQTPTKDIMNRFAAVIERLQTIFAQAAPGHTQTVIRQFGMHIPPEMQKWYTSLTHLAPSP